MNLYQHKLTASDTGILTVSDTMAVSATQSSTADTFYTTVFQFVARGIFNGTLRNLINDDTLYILRSKYGVKYQVELRLTDINRRHTSQYADVILQTPYANSWLVIVHLDSSILSPNFLAALECDCGLYRYVAQTYDMYFDDQKKVPLCIALCKKVSLMDIRLASSGRI